MVTSKGEAKGVQTGVMPTPSLWECLRTKSKDTSCQCFPFYFSFILSYCL